MTRTSAMKIISRAATRQIAAIKARRLRCVAHCRDGGAYLYEPRECDPEWAWEALEGHRARLTAENGGWTVRTGSGDWYTLTEITPLSAGTEGRCTCGAEIPGDLPGWCDSGHWNGSGKGEPPQ